MNKTFAELGYNVGDTVRCVNSCGLYDIGEEHVLELGFEGSPSIKKNGNGISATWELVSRAGSTDAGYGYLSWRDMTPEAQGALLLAEYNGHILEQRRKYYGTWETWETWETKHYPPFISLTKYRVKPAKPVVVTHEKFGNMDSFYKDFFTPMLPSDTHKITYNTIDGVIDCASVRMVEIEK